MPRGGENFFYLVWTFVAAQSIYLQHLSSLFLYVFSNSSFGQYLWHSFFSNFLIFIIIVLIPLLWLLGVKLLFDSVKFHFPCSYRSICFYSIISISILLFQNYVLYFRKKWITEICRQLSSFDDTARLWNGQLDGQFDCPNYIVRTQGEWWEWSWWWWG